jgi:hypothetical protein
MLAGKPRLKRHLGRPRLRLDDNITITSAYKMLAGKPRLKRHLGRPRLRLEDNIRISLKEIGINTSNSVD